MFEIALVLTTSSNKTVAGAVTSLGGCVDTFSGRQTQRRGSLNRWILSRGLLTLRHIFAKEEPNNTAFGI